MVKLVVWVAVEDADAETRTLVKEMEENRDAKKENRDAIKENKENRDAKIK